MTEHEEAMHIEAVKNKTYAYFDAFLSSLVSGNAVLFVFSAIMSYSHTGIDTSTDMPAGHDLRTSVIFIVLAFVFFLLLFFIAGKWFKRIRALEKKLVTVVVSLVVYIALIPILGYLTLLTYGMILWK